MEIPISSEILEIFLGDTKLFFRQTLRQEENNIVSSSFFHQILNKKNYAKWAKIKFPAWF